MGRGSVYRLISTEATWTRHRINFWTVENSCVQVFRSHGNYERKFIRLAVQNFARTERKYQTVLWEHWVFVQIFQLVGNLSHPVWTQPESPTFLKPVLKKRNPTSSSNIFNLALVSAACLGKSENGFAGWQADHIDFYIDNRKTGKDVLRGFFVLH